jgi:hypothetical protein
LELCEEKGEKQADFGEVARRGQVQLLLKEKQNSQQHPGENTKKQSAGENSNTTKTVSNLTKI